MVLLPHRFYILHEGSQKALGSRSVGLSLLYSLVAAYLLAPVVVLLCSVLTVLFPLAISRISLLVGIATPSVKLLFPNKFRSFRSHSPRGCMQ